MSEPTIVHATSVLERTFAVPPSRVFHAFSDRDAKRRWFGGAGDASSDWELDFRVGGSEVTRGSIDGGPTYSYLVRYLDIVEGQRIVLTSEMYLDDARISVSVESVELFAEGDGSRLVLTLQGAYLDGLDTPAQREHGTSELLDALAASLATEGVNA